jgi:uncharacterized protein
MRIVCDEFKRAENIRKHGYDFAAVELDFFQTAVVISADDNRLKALNVFAAKVIVVIFYVLGSQGISIISMRPASRAERELYEQAQIEHSSDN